MTSSLSSEILELTPAQLGRLNEDELFLLREAAKQERYDKLDVRCSQRLASKNCGPLYWLQNLTKTVDDQASQTGLEAYRRFPNKTYFLALFHALLNEKRLLIAKTRQMLTSWAICGYVAWLCQWNPGTTAVIQTMKEEKAGELCRYIRVLTEQQEPFLQERHPVTNSTRLAIEWGNGSRVFGIPGGEHQVRMYHPGVMNFDEIGAMEDAQQCWDTASPVAVQMIGVSSARPGWMGDECSI